MGKHEPSVLAIDLGGTQIRVAIISSQGQIMAKESYPTLAAEGPEPVIGRIFSAIDRLLKAKGDVSPLPSSISIAAAGAIDYEQGLITLSPNLPGWHNISLRGMVKERCGRR